MANRNPYERLRETGFGWVIYLMFGLVIAGLSIIAIGLTIFPGPLLLVGAVVLGVGIWGVSPLFSKAQPGNRRNIPQHLRDQVWERDIGDDRMTGYCYVCSHEINYRRFEAGHITAVAHGGSDRLENLRAICGQCNRAMGTTDLEEYKTRFYGSNPRDPGRARRARRRQ